MAMLMACCSAWLSLEKGCLPSVDLVSHSDDTPEDWKQDSTLRHAAHGAGEDPPLDRLRAAARLVDNHEAVARFAARGLRLAGAAARLGASQRPDSQARRRLLA